MKSQFAGLPRAYWLLVAGMFVNRLGGFVLPFLSLYLASEERLTTGEAGVVLGCWGVGCMTAMLIGGTLADRWGRRPTMLASLCAGAVVIDALAFAHGFAQLAALAFLLGSTADVYRPALAAAITDLAPPSLRARAFGHLTWAYNVAFAVSPLVAGWVARDFGYAWLFHLDAATMLAAGVVIAIWVPETRPERIEPGEAAPAMPWRELASNASFVLLLASSFALGLVVIQAAASLAHVMRADAIDAKLYGRIIAVNGLIIALTQPWMVPLCERAGRYRVLPWAALVFGAGFGAHALAGTPLTHVLAIAAWTLGEVAIFPLTNAVAADIAPAAHRGRYMGAYWMAWTAANVVGPPLGLFVLGRFGEPAWGIGLASLGVLGALALRGIAPRQAAERSVGVARESTDSSTV